MKKVLIVVDMLNDFVDEKGALQFPQARDIVDYVDAVVKEFKENRDHVIFLMDSHAEDDLEFNLFPKHAVKGTWGSKLIDKLADTIKPFGQFIRKTRYSGFYATNLEDTLFDIEPDEVHVVGVCTSICVMDTVGGLANRDYKVFVHKNGVADFNDDANLFALTRMRDLYGAKMV